VERFRWGGDKNKHKIHCKKWEKIVILKSEGGMRFRELELFNQAMLAKQGWRLLPKPDLLCVMVLKGSSTMTHILCQLEKKRNPSHVLNAILHEREAQVRDD
jgi:hypothetical protein